MKNLTWAILIASGRDDRLAASVSTPFLFLNDRPVITYVLTVIEQTPELAGVIVVIDRDNAAELAALMKTYRFSKIRKVVGAGVRRQASMSAAFAYIDPEADFICVLDACRPLLNASLVSETIRAAWRVSGGVATAAEEVLDPIALVKRNAFQSRLPADAGHVWTLLPPQVFPRQLLMDAYDKKRKVAGDDLETVLSLSSKLVPHLVPAPPACHVGVRIRSAADLATATAFLHDPNRI